MQNPQKKTTNKPKIILLLTLSAAAGIIYYTFFHHPILNNIKAKIEKDQPDPNATKYRNIKTSLKSGKPYYCGEYNAKNTNNGYIGYKRFMAEKTKQPLIIFTEGNWDKEEFKLLWPEYCHSL